MRAAASRDWPLAEKSSVAELPLNLTWNIYAFSGSFASLDWMTARFKGRIDIQPPKRNSLLLKTNPLLLFVRSAPLRASLRRKE
jgi:hypothetical protein